MSDHEHEGPGLKEVLLPKLYEVFGIPYKHTLYAAIAEFEDGPQLVEAGKRVREAGYTKLDAITPFPVHGIDDAIGIPRSILGWIVIPIAFFGTANALLMMWYTGAYEGPQIPGCELIGMCSYPQVIGGKPLFHWVFGLPIMFELSILFAAFASVIGMFVLNGLPRMHHPSFNYSNIRRATDDRFLLVVEATDPKFKAEETLTLLKSCGAVHTELVEDNIDEPSLSISEGAKK
jgi:hypothetical protein